MESKVLLCLLFLMVAGRCAAQDATCQTFAGGSVYPRETGKSSGHSLQWTRAMSEFIRLDTFK